MEQDRRHFTSRVECDLSNETKEFLTHLAKPPIGETSIEQKLEAIIEMLTPLGSIPSRLEMMETRLETIHGLITDLSADPEKAKELSERIQKQVEALKSATTKSEII